MDDQRAAAADPAARASAVREKAPNGRTGAAYRSPVATYDQQTGKVTWARPGHAGANIAYDGGAAQLFGGGLLEVDAALSRRWPTTRSSS